MNKEKNNEQSKYFVNENIRSDSILVITESGENLGVMTKRKALTLAQESGLDLVQVGEKDSSIIAKIMDFGKFLYLKKKQLNESKKHQVVVQIKEIKMRPHIDAQDYKTKLNQAERFFQEGKHVKFTLQFKGREAAMMDELGHKLFNKILSDLAERNVGPLQEEKEGRSGITWSKILYVKGK